MRGRAWWSLCVLVAGCVEWVEVGSFDDTLAPDAGGPDPTVPEGGASDAGAVDADVEPAAVPLARTRLAAGALSTCALRDDEVLCWGDNESGTLGSGSFAPRTRVEARPVVSLGPARAVVGGPFAHCAILTDGSARCWGDSIFGSIEGSPSHVRSSTPHDYFGLGDDVAQLSHGLYFGCAVTTSARVKCWGLAGNGQLGTGGDGDEYVARDIAAVGEPLLQVSASMGGLFACAVGSSGNVYCWGDNNHGQLGEGTSSSATPRVVPELGGSATAVAAGRSHVCARLDSGQVRCWGDNRRGQVDGSPAGAPRGPTEVPDLRAVREVRAGGEHSCAISDEGAVWCWGANDSGQIDEALGASRPPTQIEGAALEVTAGFAHTCTLHESDRVRCRGDGSRDQTGGGELQL